MKNILHKKSFAIFNESQKVAAIVPAYNEHARIEQVVAVLARSPRICEVIVVDDGSDTPLTYNSETHPFVRVIRHTQNKGKAAAMETGVQATGARFIFFCDADLVGLTEVHLAALIDPVVSGSARMSIGVRQNWSQRVSKFIALHSGERCLPRADWLSLHPFYKKRFRIEAGLNTRAWTLEHCVLVEHMSYRQTVRERKYGFFNGVAGRFQMALDISAALLFAAYEYTAWRAQAYSTQQVAGV